MLESFDSVIGEYADGTVVLYESVSSQIIGKTEKELQDVAITRLQYGSDDFFKRLDAAVNLILVNKEVFDTNTDMMADLATMFLAVKICEHCNGSILTGLMTSKNVELHARLLSNYLLLPFYLNTHNKPRLYGLDHGMLYRSGDYSVGGKIMVSKFRIVYLIAGGKRFSYKYGNLDLRDFFRNRMYRRAAKNMNAMLMDADVEKIMGSSYEV